MPEVLKILLVEDDVADAELASREMDLAHMHFTVNRVETRADYIKALAEYAPDVILSDHALPEFDGDSALLLARKALPNTPFIFVSGTLGEDKAVESLKHGASDYVIKGDLHRLPSSILRALEEKRLRRERERAILQLRASEAMFKSLVEQAPIGILLSDITGKPTFCNNYLAQILGRSVSEAISMNWKDWFHPDDQGLLAANAEKHLGAKEHVIIEYRVLRPSGEVRWVDDNTAPQFGPDGKHIGFLSLFSDKTEHKLAEEKIARLSRIQEVLSDINSTIVRVSDRQQLLNDVCRIAITKGKFKLAWIGIVDPETLLIKTEALECADNTLSMSSLFLKVGVPLGQSKNCLAVYQSQQPLTVNSLPSTPSSTGHVDKLHDAGIQSMLYLPILLDNEIFGVIALCADTVDFFTDDELHLLTDLSEDVAFALGHLDKAERINYLAYYDALTGLPNRTLFLDHLKQYIDNAKLNSQQLTVVLFDLDKFRHINESFGENAGDAVLRMAAERLKRSATDTTVLGRIGGDIFGAILPNTPDAAVLTHLFERQLSDWSAEPFLIAGQEISLAFKAGICLFPDDGDNADTLFQNANAALKQTKTTNQSLLFYSRNINERVSEQLKLENRLRHAIQEEQFVLHYQPKVELATNRVKSVEALIRWRDPERGMIAPGEFISILEETGLIKEVGLWALQRAYGDHARLRTFFGIAPRIAVNVSAVQLQRDTFVEDVAGVIGKTGQLEHGIDIELTESLIMSDIENNILKLNALRDQNVNIAIDDFGTGYSSLSYIAKLPIDVLKIDRSFIMRMDASKEDMTIVSTIIALAHSLGLKVVAEGVETEEQKNQLHMLKCDEAQGYLLCRPLPLESLMAELIVRETYLELKSTKT